MAVRDQVKRSMLWTTTREDGSRQLTYDGPPLYYFARDRGPGQVTGQGVKGFGAEWYLIAPDGSVIRGHR